METEAKKQPKLGIIDSDLVSLINWKKAKPEKRKTLICNQLSMVEDYTFHEFWWKLGCVNPELYWELQYEWLDHHYFHTGVFKERAKRCLKKLNFVGVAYHFIHWVMWSTTVNQNYQIHVKLPYFIRNGKPSDR